MKVGPWILLERLGQGGMGVVWRVRHEHSGLLGALKAHLNATPGFPNSPYHSSDPARHAAGLRQVELPLVNWREVDALARLDHPNIIAIYDQGHLPPVTSDGLPPRAPYYVMALADRSLAAELARRTLSWLEVRAVLEATLRALCHLHAHGLLHRDIKPDNVLLMGHDVTCANLRLADFGLAAEAGARLGGTPTFMAPEQLRGWRGVSGPWTDLYAVGVLGRRLVGGRLPVSDEHDLGPTCEQLGAERLTPTIGVPDGLEAWLRKLVAQPPETRPYAAAAVLAELLALDTPAWDGGTCGTSLDAATLPEDAKSLDTPRHTPREAPNTEARPTTRAALAGLGLVGRRVYPLIGRDQPMAALMEAAERTRTTRRPEVMTIAGPPGIGKRRLIDAHLARLAERYPLRWSRLRDGDDLAGLVLGALALPRDAEPYGSFVEGRLDRIGAPRWVRAVVTRTLAGERAALDEGAVGAALGWIMARLEVLWVVIAEHGAKDSVGRVVRGLLAVDGPLWIVHRGDGWDVGRTWSLGPLSHEAGLFLTREVLELDAGLATAITVAAAGHPRTLVTLLRELVEHDVLRPSARGWSATRPIGPWLRDALARQDQGAGQTLAELTDEPTRSALAAVALAALRPTLGQVMAVLGRLKLDATAAIERLLATGLVLLDEGRLSLARPSYGPAIIAATPNERALREAWVACFEDESAQHEGSVAEQAHRGAAWTTQLVALGRDAVDTALAASRLHLERGALGDALAIAELGLATRGDEKLALCRAEALAQLGRDDEARKVLETLTLPEANWLRGQLLRHEGRHAEAIAAYDTLSASLTDPVERANAMIRKAMSLRELGRIAEGEAEIAAAAPWLERSDTLDRIALLRVKAQYLRALDRPLERLDVAREAVALSESLGAPGELAAALTDVAGSATRLGRHDEALDALTRSYALSRAFGRADQAIDLLNLGLVHLAHGSTEEADTHLDQAIAALTRLGWKPPLAAAHTLKLVSLGRLGHWHRWPTHLDAAELLLSETGIKDPDIARALSEAQTLLERSGPKTAEAGTTWAPRLATLAAGQAPTA